jgi:hypothetical protein
VKGRYLVPSDEKVAETKNRQAAFISGILDRSDLDLPDGNDAENRVGGFGKPQ